MKTKRPARPVPSTSRARARRADLPSPFPDFVDAVTALNTARARYLVVGAYAMAAHGVPRATGDLDIWVDATEENGRRVFEALVRFGAPLTAMGVTLADLSAPGAVCQIGLPPRRIDITTIVDGVSFEEAWGERLRGTLGSVRLNYIGRNALLRNKLAAGRAKDLADVVLLKDTPPRE